MLGERRSAPNVMEYFRIFVSNYIEVVPICISTVDTTSQTGPCAAKAEGSGVGMCLATWTLKDHLTFRSVQAPTRT